jgi:hypothetical protein
MLVAVAGQGGLVMDPAAALTEVLPPLALPALVYAHLMDRGAAAAGVDVAAWHAALASPPGSSNSNIGGGARTDGSDTDSSSDGAASNGQGGVTNRAGSPGSGSEGGGETSDGSFQRSPSPSPEAQVGHLGRQLGCSGEEDWAHLDVCGNAHWASGCILPFHSRINSPWNAHAYLVTQYPCHRSQPSLTAPPLPAMWLLQGLPEASWGPEASSLQEQYTSLARYQLELRTKGVGLDELAPTAR